MTTITDREYTATAPSDYVAIPSTLLTSIRDTSKKRERDDQREPV
jgi:hypothetical protein